MKTISIQGKYWFQKIKKIFLLGLVLFSIQGGMGQEVLDWDTIPAGEDDNRWDGFRNDVTSFIWNQLDDNTFFNQWLYPQRARISFRAQRRVYDNRTPDNKYTVVDSIYLPLGVPLHSYQFNGGNYGISLNLNLNTKIAHFRQINSGEITRIESISEWNKNARKLMREGKKIGLIKNENSAGRNKLKDFFDDNPLSKARYSKVWNLLTHPFKLPFTKKRVLEMDPGEIHSYTLSGHLALSGHVGWKTPKIPNVGGVNLAASLTTFLYGDYRISVMKEEDQKVQVKVTRLKSAGISANGGGTSDYYTPFQGVFLLNKLGLRVVPFQISAKKEWMKQFDVGYRFDLNEPDALEAYLKASTGNFKRAEELMLQERGVEKTFTKKSDSVGSHSRFSLNLGPLFSRYNSSTNKVSRIELTLPDGKTEIFRAFNSNGKGYRSIFGVGEDQGQTFITTFQKETSSLGDPLTLRVKGHIWDNRSSGTELRQYVDKIQNVIGDRYKFPSFPVHGPRKVCPEKMMRRLNRIPEHRKSLLRTLCLKSNKSINYGHSSFNYKMAFTLEQLKKFIHFPKDEMWRVLEGAFRVKEGSWLTQGDRAKYALKFLPASLIYGPTVLMGVHIREGGNLVAAKRFQTYWAKLSNAKNKKELTKLFGELFKTFSYGFEFIRVLKESMKDESYLLSVNANNAKTFGQVAFTDPGFTDQDPIDYTLEDRVNFEKPYKTNIDYNSVLSHFKVGRVGKERVAIAFKTDKMPKYFFIQVDKSPPFRARKNLFKSIFKNNDGLLQKGKNILSFQKDAFGEGLEGLLSKYLFLRNSRVTVTMSLSHDGKNWGPLYKKHLKKWDRKRVWDRWRRDKD